MNKICSKCKKELDITHFYKDKSKVDNLRPDCKECAKKSANEYYDKNKDKIIQRSREYYIANKERIDKRNNKWNKDNKEKKVKYDKEWKRKNAKKLKLYQDRYYKENREKIMKRANDWKKKNRGRFRELQKKSDRRLRKDPMNRVHDNFSRRIRKGLKKNSVKTFNILGYSVNELRKHLEKQFDKKMNWDNYGSYWHIDHIRPVSSFTFSGCEDSDFKKCWSLSNLQPLEAKENIRKSNNFSGTINDNNS